MQTEDIRFRQLGYVALNVSSLAASRHFYETLVGLQCDMAIEERSSLFLRCSDKHHDIMLVESSGPVGVKRVGWEMESQAAFRALRGSLEGQGIVCTDVSEDEARFLGIPEAFRISEPVTGLILEFFPSMERSSTPYRQTHTQIARLGHLVINSADRPTTEAFLREKLNFKVSDRIDGMVSFMRCFPNPYHHSLGVGAAPSSGLNHVNFMVSCIDDIGKGNNRMKHNGVDIVFGPGKHPPSESFFLYFLDPDGMTIEYSFGMEEFPEVEARAPRAMPASLESVDYWGGRPDPRSGKGGVIETAEAVVSG